MTPQYIVCDMKQTLWEYAAAFSTVKKWHSEFQQGNLARPMIDPPLEARDNTFPQVYPPRLCRQNSNG